MIPRATYRLQLQKGFPFARVAELASYLASLGISHVYLSPILAARPGSAHGYDVVDHSTINPELGGESGFRSMAARLREEGIGIIVDIVPNHMAVTSAENRWWMDVLEHGKISSYAKFFDIDWQAPGLVGRVLAPFLGMPPGEALKSGELELHYDANLQKYVFAYHSLRFPLRADDQDRLRHWDLRGLSMPELSTLLAHQHYVLADWREADGHINWRRFFAITDLAALRVECDEVFEAVHGKVFALYSEGLIDGVRVDHVDGLSDPRAYCRKLRMRLDHLAQQSEHDVPAYIVVEKILASDELLPNDWLVDGTTGYDFMNEVSALEHAREPAKILDQLWRRYGGRGSVFEREERAARRQVLARSFNSQLMATARAFSVAADLGSAGGRPLQNALKAVIREMRCYRTYATGRVDSPPPGPYFARAIEKASELNPSQAEAVAMVARVMSGSSCNPVAVEAIRRFNQLCASVAAKAVEDTALYRYGRLLSRNDVGSDPRQETMSTDEFHARMEYRMAEYPSSMLSTATHDHKRGEDTRARLAVLSEVPVLWRRTVTGWYAMNDAFRPDNIRRADEYQLYQTLFGVWPPDGSGATDFARLAERLQGWSNKYLREAKLRSRWRTPNESYEKKFHQFVDGLLTAPSANQFRSSMDSFVAYARPAALANSIAQCTLRCTLPGVPDLYQGCEFLDFSMVDPDNRRAVDYAARREALGSGPDLMCDDHIKLGILSTLLRFRRDNPEMFRWGTYRRLPVSGERKDHILAFERRLGDRRLIVFVAIRCAAALCGSQQMAPDRSWWSDTAIGSPDDWAGRLQPVIGPSKWPQSNFVALALIELPVFAALLC